MKNPLFLEMPKPCPNGKKEVDDQCWECGFMEYVGGEKNYYKCPYLYILFVKG